MTYARFSILDGLRVVVQRIERLGDLVEVEIAVPRSCAWNLVDNSRILLRERAGPRTVIVDGRVQRILARNEPDYPGEIFVKLIVEPRNGRPVMRIVEGMERKQRRKLIKKLADDDEDRLSALADEVLELGAEAPEGELAEALAAWRAMAPGDRRRIIAILEAISTAAAPRGTDPAARAATLLRAAEET